MNADSTIALVTVDPRTKPTVCESADIGCYHPQTRRHLLLLLHSPKADTHFADPMRLEG